MSFRVLAFVFGISCVQQWSRLPVAFEWGALLAMTVFFCYRRWLLMCVFLFGVLWASIYGSWRLADRLAENLQGQDVAVQGYIVSLPQQQDNRCSFDFIVTEAVTGVPGKLHLNWYYPKIALRAGQTWQMTVRLKKPHGRANPGGFDYEAWSFAHHIGASGYVRSKPLPIKIDPGFYISRYLASYRQAISDRLDRILPASQQLGVIKALSIGSQDLISQRQWQVFRITGIVHLMVISGAHISLVAGLVFLCVRRWWAWTGLLSVSPQNMAACLAWFAALFYAALAGFSIPTQRAMVMLTVGLLAVIWQRNTAALPILFTALWAVLLFDPLAVLSVGFWLSFAAVALLLYVSAGRLGKSRYWLQATKLHIAMAVGLAPLLIVFFQQISLISPVANFIAVPVIGLLVTPLCLLTAGLSFISSGLASIVAWPVEQLLQGIWWLLQYMADWPLASMTSLPPPWYAVLFALVGMLLLLAPRGMPGRYLSVFLCLPLFFIPTERPRFGEIWFTLLDVGQGLAAVVQTQRHALVFDTGAKYSQQADMGEAVVLPFLQYQGVDRLDGLVVSHGDNDHSGGAAALLTAMPGVSIYSSVPEWAEHSGGQYCRAGQSWSWDGVNFKMLSPSVKAFESENDNSCVLQISNAEFSLLLTGDIQARAEKWLIEEYGAELASSILVAPHHGSKTSSSSDFLAQVKPDWVLIPAGYMNRFGFPHAEVLQRYKKQHINSFSTAEAGAISLKTSGSVLDIQLTRHSRRKYWMDNQ